MPLGQVARQLVTHIRDSLAEFHAEPIHLKVMAQPAETLVLLDKYIASGHNSDQPGHYMRWLAETDALFAASLSLPVEEERKLAQDVYRRLHEFGT